MLHKSDNTGTPEPGKGGGGDSGGGHFFAELLYSGSAIKDYEGKLP